MKDLLTMDLGWKLFSLFLALGIWLTVHKINEESDVIMPAPSVGSTVTYKSLPVLIVSAASDVRDFRVAPGTVSVVVSGPIDVMTKLLDSQIRAMVDLSDVTNSAWSGNLTRLVEVSAPSGVTLISVTPDKVGVILPPRH